MNRKQRREMARAVVRRGASSGHVAREARRVFAKNINQAIEEKKRTELEEHTEKLGLTIVKNKLEIASGLPERKA